MNVTPRYLDDRYNIYPEDPQLTKNNSRSESQIERINTSRNESLSIKHKYDPKPGLPNNLEKINESLSKELRSSQTFVAENEQPIFKAYRKPTQRKHRLIKENQNEMSNKDALDLSPENQEDQTRNIENIKSSSQQNLDKEIDHSPVYDLQQIIDQSRGGDVIQLPNQVVKVDRLVIKRPITIIGSVTSLIEVTHSIEIDLSEYSGKAQRKVIFSECTIHFEYGQKKFILNQSILTKRSNKSEEYRVLDKISYSESISNQTKLLNGQLTTDIQKSEVNDRIYPLFVIYHDSTVEVRDCNISSKNNRISSHIFPDVCFYIHNEKRSILEELNTHIFIQSVFINDFLTTVQNDIFGKIYLEKLFISGSKGHAINISNPHVVEIKECVIENPAKSGINIRFSKEVASKIPRRVLIEKNEINKGQSYGMSIFGENMKVQICDIYIIENKISECRKDAIGIKNLNITQIKIEKNQIFNNQGSGLFLQNVLDTSNLNQIKIIENKIIQSKMYGIALTDVPCFAEKNQVFQNEKGGVLINGGEKLDNHHEYQFYKQYPLRTILNSNQINNNKDSGVIVIGGLKGPLILNSCEVYENMNGVYLKQAPLMLKTDAQSTTTSTTSFILGDIVLEKCILFQNKLSGIHIKSITNKLYLKETSISENKNYALFLQNEEQKESLVLRDAEKGKLRDYISGYIGGSWGVLHSQKVTTCKANKCAIF